MAVRQTLSNQFCYVALDRSSHPIGATLMSKGYRTCEAIVKICFCRVLKIYLEACFSWQIFSARMCLFLCKWQTLSKTEINLIKMKHFSFLFYGYTHK